MNCCTGKTRRRVWFGFLQNRTNISNASCHYWHFHHCRVFPHPREERGQLSRAAAGGPSFYCLHLWGSLIFVKVRRRARSLSPRPKPMTFAHPRVSSWINDVAQTTLHRHLFASRTFALPHLAGHLNSHGAESPQSVSDTAAGGTSLMPKKKKKPFVHSLTQVQEGFRASFFFFLVRWGNDSTRGILKPWSKLLLFCFWLLSLPSIFPGALQGTVASLAVSCGGGCWCLTSPRSKA